MRLVARLGCCVAILLHGAVASGFCRTTTSKAPAGYNPATSGCWTAGVPLSWHIARVPYAVASSASQQISLTDAIRVADLAFGAWNRALCGGQSLGIQAYDEGPVSVPQGGGEALAAWGKCTDSSSCNPQAHDVIVFDDDSWPYDDPANTLALTTVTYGVDDGRIFQAYTEVNTAGQQLTAEEPPPEGSGAYDLQAVLTHEAGHFLGLAHATDTSAIMYAFYQPGAIRLTGDDLDGICTVYPHGVPPGSATQTTQEPLGIGSCTCDAVGAAAPYRLAALGALSLAVLACLRKRAARGRRRS